MNKGDIILIPFPFTDLSGNKNRPALILIESDEDVTICFITAQLKWQSEYDIIIQPSQINGLKRTSLLKLNKFATIDKDLILGKLGFLETFYMNQLNENLMKLLKIS